MRTDIPIPKTIKQTVSIERRTTARPMIAAIAILKGSNAEAATAPKKRPRSPSLVAIPNNNNIRGPPTNKRCGPKRLHEFGDHEFGDSIRISALSPCVHGAGRSDALKGNRPQPEVNTNSRLDCNRNSKSVRRGGDPRLNLLPRFGPIRGCPARRPGMTMGEIDAKAEGSPNAIGIKKRHGIAPIIPADPRLSVSTCVRCHHRPRHGSASPNPDWPTGD